MIFTNFRNAEKFQEYRKTLPIWQQKDDIMQTILHNQVTIVTGETGSGKTTQVPQFILDHSFDNSLPCKIVCAEPRRLGMIYSQEVFYFLKQILSYFNVSIIVF